MRDVGPAELPNTASSSASALGRALNVRVYVTPARNVPVNVSVSVSLASRSPPPRSQRPDAGDVSNTPVSRVMLVPELAVQLVVFVAKDGLSGAGDVTGVAVTPASWLAERSTMTGCPSAPVPSTITRL